MSGLKGTWSATIISDSEEERTRIAFNGVIEISSDSSDDDSQPAGSRLKESWDYRNPLKSKADVPISLKDTSLRPRKNFKANYLRSRVVESSDSESDERRGNRRQSTHCIRLPQNTDVPRMSQVTQEEETQPPTPRNTPTHHTLTKQTSSMVVEVDSDSNNDDAILVFDEPKSSRQPIPTRRPNPKASTAICVDGIKAHVAFPPSKDTFGPDIPDTDAETFEHAPKVCTPRTKNRSSKKPAGALRVTNKKRKQEQQEELHDYAQTLFAEINLTVFQQRLPEETKLHWNKRLLTTAGRARWHRSRDGVQTAEIELSEKILTSFERIRNTLSHEMCHLACWIVDKEIKEAHGKFWKAWTRKIMQQYPEIDISTRHDYDIEYPFKWKCAKCDKVYGRFSKSIKPDECLCGACREGRLIPQFTTAIRGQKTPKMSRMAATKIQGSPFTPTTCEPSSAPSAPTVGDVICISSDSEDDDDVRAPTRFYHSRASICEIPAGDDDSDSEVEILATTFRTTSINDVD